MQVHPIQPADNDLSFKAHFINDAKGNFRNLWRMTEINTELIELAKTFKNNNKGHSLEITKMNDNGYELSASIFNNRTGATHRYLGLRSLKHVIENLMKDTAFFDETTKSARLFQNLTGQKTHVDVVL